MLFVRHSTVAAVIVYPLAAHEYPTLFRIDPAIAVASPAVDDIDTIVIETEMHTGAEIAVEILYLMALFIFGIERAEIGVSDPHIVKIEVVDQCIIAEILQFLDDPGMFFGMCFIPLRIGHRLFSACISGLRDPLAISSRKLVA